MITFAIRLLNRTSLRTIRQAVLDMFLRFWGALGGILDLFWSHWPLVVSQGCLGSPLGSLWGAFGSFLGPFWGRFGSILGPFWRPVGDFLRSAKLSGPEGGFERYRGGPKCVLTAQVQRFRGSAHRRGYSFWVTFGLRKWRFSGQFEDQFRDQGPERRSDRIGEGKPIGQGDASHPAPSATQISQTGKLSI